MIKNKKIILNLGFKPKENISDIFIKKYKNTDNNSDYFLEVDVEKKIIYWGEKIFIGEKNQQNITKPEDLVVLECVDRLLEKGYKPEDIVLEKVFPSGHGHSGRLDICVKKNDKTFLMIECKTWGQEFKKEFKNLEKNGGQLFTYFQNDKNAEFLVLYASQFDEKNNQIEYENEIVTIDESYRQTANVKDLFDRWNKQTKDNGVFEDWVNSYHFESRALQMKDLKDIKEEDSSFIFNRFLEILRHNAVSDKGNAFTKIFTLFLCKVKDEDRNKTEELDFQWKDSDDAESFQVRLSDLYRMAMREFLDKEVSDFSDSDFEEKYGTLDESVKSELKKEFIKVRLQKSNEFAIKDVFDKETFEENNIVLKEVVELLQPYKFRYNKKQPFLGEFFELLLTTGLKQESGQFFTPVPIARFICKSVPLKDSIEEKLQQGERDELLPNVIDYAAGSGHFLTESMEEIQNIVEKIDISELPRPSKKEVQTAQIDPFGWAFDYVYGVERDYRLVKTTKVGCYLHGDGIANIIHGDGLDSFTNSKKYKGKLKKFEEENNTENAKFDFVLSNPPYSVSSFKGNTHNDTFEDDFELYEYLTDQSSEIEALFIERTKQLLKKDGIATLILPASILSNTGIYTKAREIILKYFEIISIVELGSNTFMATGTSTVTLFLRRRSNYFWKATQEKISGFFEDQNDKTINGIENIFSKYVSHVFEDDENNSINFSDYQSLISGKPNENILKSEFFIEYNKKLSSKIYTTEAKKLEKILEIEKEKILYFVLAYGQEIVLVNSGQKKEEKKFLGYEFSSAKKRSGVHPISRGKTIDECTSLYDDTNFYNSEKASTYILEAFEKKPKREISENLKKNISRVDLVDMLTFDRVYFEKTVSTAVKKKIKIESKWEIVKIGNVLDIQRGVIYKKEQLAENITSNIILPADNISLSGDLIIKKQIYLKNSIEIDNKKNLQKNDIFMCFSSGSLKHLGKMSFIKKSSNYYAGGFMGILRGKTDNNIQKYFFEILNSPKYRNIMRDLGSGSNINNLSSSINELKIPLPPLNIQQKIVDECEKMDNDVRNAEEKIIERKKEISEIIKNIEGETKRLSSVIEIIGGGTPSTKNSEYWNGDIPWLSVVDFNNEDRYVSETEKYITKEGLNKSSTKILKEGDLIISARGTVGAIAQLKIPMAFNQSCYGLRGLSDVDNGFLYYAVKNIVENLKDNAYGAVFDAITIKTFDSVSISIPDFKTQQKIVSEIEKIEAEISANQKIIDEAGIKKEEILKKYL